MSTVPGPIISFQIDSESLVAATKATLDQMNAQIKQATAQTSAQLRSAIAGPLETQAAKLRALYSTGAIGIKDLQVQQKLFVAQLDQEIARLTKKDALNKAELSTLKAITLERERQANALSRGVGVGVTSGTQSALGLVTGSLTKNVSQLGARLVGVAGGSGLETTAFTAAASGIDLLTSSGGAAVGVLGALGTAIAAVSASAVALAISGGALAQRFSDISQKTGISIKNLQVLDAIAKSSDLDLEDLVTGFGKFSQALTGPVGDKATDTLKVLGVSSKDSFAALQQLADAFSKLPDGPQKSAAAIELFGRSGLQLIPILDQGREGIEKYREIIAQVGPDITGTVLKAQDDWQQSTIKLGLAFDALKVKLAPLLGDFAKIIDPTTGPGFFSKMVVLLSGGLPELSGALKDNADFASIAADQWRSLGLGFDDANKAIQKLSPVLKQLADLQAGVAAARQKSIEEGQKELQALDADQFKTALGTLQSLSTSAQTVGLTDQDKALEEQRQKLEQIAELILNFPQLAGQASTAVTAITSATTRQLEQMADAALQKVQDQNNRDDAEVKKRQDDLANIIRDSENQLAIDRAAASGNAVAQILADNKKRLDDTIAKATLEGATEEQLQKLRVEANEDAQAKIQKLQLDQLKKTQDDIKQAAGQLFDSLVQGSKSFGAALKQALLAAALTPVKLIFEAVASAVFTPIVTGVKKELADIGKSLSGKGGILGAIGKQLEGANGPIDDNTDATKKNTDALDNLTKTISGGVPGSSGGSNATISGLGSVLFGTGGTGLILNGLPTGGTGSVTGAGSGIGGGLANFLGPAILGTGILASGGGKVAAGISALGGLLATKGGGSIGGLINIAKNPLGSPKIGTLGLLGLATEGAGIGIAGHNTGGVLGALEGAGGGALTGASIGTLIAPGIGTAVGAVVGAVAGFIGGILGGGKTKAQKIQEAITRQAVNPNLIASQEFDRAVSGSFAQTSNTTFSEQPGGVFDSFAISGGARQAPVVIHYSPTVQAFDSRGVDAVLQQHGTRIAQAVSGQVRTSASGFGRAAREAVSPA